MTEHLYLHVPFCKTICYYCDFCHRVYNRDTVLKWLSEVKKEIDSKNINRNLKTVYIGGGTPTSLSKEELNSLLILLDPYTDEVIEYTVEVNPETLDEEKANILLKHKVNRVSLGVQSFNENLLSMMNRKHCIKDIENCIELLRNKGISNISCDLMYSLPLQTADDFLDSLNKLVKMDIPHISFYSLQIEENSVFGKKGYTALDEDTEASMYEMGRDYLVKEGYRQYEISNYCKPGYESKHNMAYWYYKDFYGISLGAAGKENHMRYQNTRNFDEYLNGNYIDETIELSKKDEMFEHLMMSLRLLEGLDLNEFKERYGRDFKDVYKTELEKSLKNNDVYIKNNHLVCNKREILNTILLEFMED